MTLKGQIWGEGLLNPMEQMISSSAYLKTDKGHQKSLVIKNNRSSYTLQMYAVRVLLQCLHGTNVTYKSFKLTLLVLG